MSQMDLFSDTLTGEAKLVVEFLQMMTGGLPNYVLDVIEVRRPGRDCWPVEADIMVFDGQRETVFINPCFDTQGRMHGGMMWQDSGHGPFWWSGRSWVRETSDIAA